MITLNPSTAELIRIEKDHYMHKPSKKKTKTKPTKKGISNFVNKIVQGDCLEVLKKLPNKSIHMVLCDLPYGTTQNKWDSVISLGKLWEHYERIIKDNGVIALTGQGVFTAKLILSNEKLFKYKIIWIKSKPTNFLNAKIQPLRKHEDICIFYKGNPTYNPQMTIGEAYDKGFRKDQYTGSYGDFKPRHVKSDGQRYPSDVVLYDTDSPFDIDNPVETAVYFKTAESEGKVYHPTQKPVELGRYLVRTYTNPGDIVLDNACGSGSFLISALLEDRKYIGIEKNENVLLHKIQTTDYIKVCKDRIKESLLNRKNIHVNGSLKHKNSTLLNGSFSIGHHVNGSFRKKTTQLPLISSK